MFAALGFPDTAEVHGSDEGFYLPPPANGGLHKTAPASAQHVKTFFIFIHSKTANREPRAALLTEARDMKSLSRMSRVFGMVEPWRGAIKRVYCTPGAINLGVQ